MAFGRYWVGQMLPYGRDVVFLGAGRDSERSVVDEQDGYLHRLVDGRVAWSSWASPYSGKPYWSSFGDVSIGTPPPSFRRIPEIPRGYFAFGSGEAPSGNRMGELLASFDLVPRIDVVGGRHLVFTLGRPDETRMPPLGEALHTSVEVYARHTGAKLYEDVPLPDGAKVLGGGRYLYVQQNAVIPPWRIAKYRLRATGRTWSYDATVSSAPVSVSNRVMCPASHSSSISTQEP